MNVQGNFYTFIYASIMVIVVAVVLSFTAIKLQPIQEKNFEIEKKQNILSSLGIESTTTEAEKLYKEYLKESFVINSKGKKIEGKDAFIIDLKYQLKETLEKRNLPLFKLQKNDSSFIVIPLRGKGLWGPVWGYVSLIEEKKVTELEPTITIITDSISGDTLETKIKKNYKTEKFYSTIYGASFDHKSETPGLGAEISKDKFEKSFRGKKLFDKSGKYKSIQINKGTAGKDNLHVVDAISGGTITSKGVEAMIDTCLIGYKKYLQKK